jgi:cellobiose phosphorylase
MEAMVSMKFGHFDDARREYVIETPATLLPWINYLGNEDFFGLISQTGGGYDFYRDAKLRRITRYRYNGVPTDNGSRSFYVSVMGADGKPVRTFSPTYLPMRTHLDRYRCRHGMGYSVFEAQCAGVSTELTAFVPLHTNAEVDQLKLTNTTDQPLTLDVTAAIEWCLWNAVDDSTNFQRNLSTGEVEIELPTQGCDPAALKAATEQYGTVSSTIYHKTEFKERRNHYAFFSVNSPLIGFDTDRATFLGQFNGWDQPAAITGGKAFDSVAHGWSPIAAPRTRITLAPGQTHTFVYVLGYIEVPKDQKWEDPTDPAKVGIINKKPAHELIARFQSADQVQQALDQLRDYWTKLLSVFHVSTGSPKLDRMANIWNQYQCMITFNLSRSASYFESGIGRGMGFRDSNQDILGFVHMAPARSRQRILDLASTQLPDGSAWHQYQPLTKRGNAAIGGGFNDDPLWLVASTYAYLAETGDSSILTEPVVFNSEKGTEKPLLEHLRRSVHFTMSHLGPHDLPLIGRADWNDCLNLNAYTDTPGESFQTVKSNKPENVAESVFIGGMFVLYAGRYAQILDLYGQQSGLDADDVSRETTAVREAVEKVRDAVEAAGWDGEWFRRAYDADSNPVGSHLNKEGKIYIEPQGMCVMAGVGLTDGKARKALTSTKKLLTSKRGTAILWPAYSTYHIELGEISSYPRGYKENGGIFCHNNPWVSIAEAVAGDSDEAFNVYWRTCPANTEEISEIHKTEPYIYCQMVAGPESFAPGEGKNSWLTGTAAWTFLDLSQYLLGVRATLSGLAVDPHLPARFSDVHVDRVYRGATYHFHFVREGAAQKASATVSAASSAADASTAMDLADQNWDASAPSASNPAFGADLADHSIDGGFAPAGDGEQDLTGLDPAQIFVNGRPLGSDDRVREANGRIVPVLPVADKGSEMDVLVRL